MHRRPQPGRACIRSRFNQLRLLACSDAFMSLCWKTPGGIVGEPPPRASAVPCFGQRGGRRAGSGPRRRVVEELACPGHLRGAGVSDDHQQRRLLPAAGVPQCRSPATPGAHALSHAF